MEFAGKKRVTRFFLGANSPQGFFSLYDGFTNPREGDFLWAIKGGPGCGKSSFMKRIGAAAESAGLDVEYIHCSGDPDSLDGVYLPQRRVAYVDGTAPHVTEAVYPGGASLYLDLGRFYDTGALKERLGEIIEINTTYKTLYDRAYVSIAASAAVNPKTMPGLAGEGEISAVKRRARGAAAREFGGPGRERGKKKYRMLSAFTCQGAVFYSETVSELCGRVYSLDNEYGLAEIYLREIEREAEERGVDTIICPDPLSTGRLEAVLVPALSLGFIARGEAELGGESYRHVRLDAMTDKNNLREKRPRIRACAKFRGELLSDAGAALVEAKALHDKLEKIYNPHVDFSGVYALADVHINALI